MKHCTGNPDHSDSKLDAEANVRAKVKVSVNAVICCRCVGAAGAVFCLTPAQTVYAFHRISFFS